MAADIVWIDHARDDLLAILDYIGKDNAAAAGSYVAGIEAACVKLAEFLKSGRAYNSRYRVVVFRNHLIFYTFEQNPDVVRIAMVIDGRRDLEHIVNSME